VVKKPSPWEYRVNGCAGCLTAMIMLVAAGFALGLGLKLAGL
jgi:hypothetical protein